MYTKPSLHGNGPTKNCNSRGFIEQQNGNLASLHICCLEIKEEEEEEENEEKEEEQETLEGVCGYMHYEFYQCQPYVRCVLTLRCQSCGELYKKKLL